MIDFLIAGTHRSRTAYIHCCLDSRSVMHCHGEVLPKRHHHRVCYHDCISLSLQQRIDHVLFRSFIVKCYLETITTAGSENVLDFKLIRSQVFTDIAGISLLTNIYGKPCWRFLIAVKVPAGLQIAVVLSLDWVIPGFLVPVSVSLRAH